MTTLEITLLALCGTLGVLLLVTLGLLIGARRRITTLRRRLLEAQQGRRRRRLALPTASQAVRGVVETAIRVADQGFGPTVRGSIADLARWADVERPESVRLAGADGEVSIMFSDIQDSTAINERLGDRAWVRLLARHDRVLTKIITRHDGHVVKSQGDGFMVAFGTADQAVAAGLDIQDAVTRSARRLSDVAVRIGVHTGSTVHRDGDLFGRNVAYASRVASLADGGEVLVSDDTLARLTLPDALVGESFETELKGLSGHHWVHRVERPGSTPTALEAADDEPDDEPEQQALGPGGRDVS